MTKLYARSGSTRAEFFSRIGVLKEVDPLVNLAYKLLNEREFAKVDQGAGAEDKWHVSFHGSQFPGDAANACGRQALYRMIDVPRKPFNRRGRQFVQIGKAFEDDLVWAWHDAGLLVSAPPNQPQTMFQDPEHWLTSTVDSILVGPRSTKPFIGEVKFVGSKFLEMMRTLSGTAIGHEKYMRQLKCQIGLAHEFGPIPVKRCHNTGAISVASEEHGRMCPIHLHGKCLEDTMLEPVSHGYLYYVSRDDPEITFEYMAEYDANFMRAGRRKLEQWQEAFLQDQLPQTNFEDKRYSHPFGWRWTLAEYPCKWCEYGDICRDDHDVAKERKGPIALHESAAVEVAERLRPGWSYESVKQAVLDRWGLATREDKELAA